MRKRGFPVLVIAVLAVLVTALTIINLSTAPPELNPISGASGMDAHAGHSHGPPPGAEPPKSKPRSAEEIAKDIERTAPTTPPAPPPSTPRMIEVVDRDDEGSSNWWDDTTSPTPENKR